MFVDTHAHIHEVDYPLPTHDVVQRAHSAGVIKIICVGTGQQSSANAVAFADRAKGIYAAIGVHPHYAREGCDELKSLVGNKNIVAIGEIGLDYFYNHSPRELQIPMLEQQLQLAQDHHLPVVFHVREAFDDFWPIFDNFPGLRGELHSFTDTVYNLEQALQRGLFIGVNGISTFTKNEAQLAMFDAIPLERLLLETDAPLLTPAPHRGTVNEPAFVRVIAQHHAQRRNIALDDIAAATTANANALFAL